MSGTTEAEVHEDTPEQAAARQLINTNATVTHVARSEEEVAEEPPEEVYSLAVTVKKTTGKPATATRSSYSSSKDKT